MSSSSAVSTDTSNTSSAGAAIATDASLNGTSGDMNATLANGTFWPEGVTCTAWAGAKEEFKDETSFEEIGVALCNSMAAGNYSLINGWMGSAVDGMVVGSDYAADSNKNTTFVLFMPHTNRGVQNCTSAVKSIPDLCMSEPSSNKNLFTTGIFDYNNATTGWAESYMFGWVSGINTTEIQDIADTSIEAAEAKEDQEAMIKEMIDDARDDDHDHGDRRPNRPAGGHGRRPQGVAPPKDGGPDGGRSDRPKGYDGKI
jgi:hypothetical protein